MAQPPPASGEPTHPDPRQAHSTPPRRRATRWVAGAVIGLVVLGAVAAGVFLALRALGGDDPATDSGEERYAYVEDVCDAIDFEPVFALMPASAGPRVDELELASGSTTTCAFDLSGDGGSGTLTTRIVTHLDGEAALRSYQESVSVKEDFWEEHQPADASWQAAEVFYSAEHGSAVQLVVAEANLTVELDFFATGGGGDRDAQLAALVQVADSVRDAMRA